MDGKIENPPSKTFSAKVEEARNGNENNIAESSREENNVKKDVGSLKNDTTEHISSVVNSSSGAADDEAAIASVSGKRRLSGSVADDDKKKPKLDLAPAKGSVDSTSPVDDVEMKNGNPTDGDDLLERLAAIDASSLVRKPDLKLDEIDSTDLEKDDLLKRLEEAENGVEDAVTNSDSAVKSKVVVATEQPSSSSSPSSSVKVTENVCDSSDEPVKDPKPTKATEKSSAEKLEEPTSSENLLNPNEAKDLHVQETALVTSPAKAADKPLSQESPPVEKMDIDDAAVSASSNSTESITSASEEAIIKFANSETKVQADCELPGQKTPAISFKLSGNAASSTPNSANTSAATDAKTKTSVLGQPSEKNFADNVSEIEPIADTTDNKSDEKSVSSEKTSSETSSADTVTKFTKKIQELNGLSSSPTSSVSDEPPPKSIEKSSIQPLVETPGNIPYTVNILYDGDDLRYLGIEKLDIKGVDASSGVTDNSSKTSSSNGSVNSLAPFSLPLASRNLSTISSDGSIVSHAKPPVKQSFTSVTKLCNFVIDHLTELKRKYDGDESKITAMSTPKNRGREPSKKILSKLNESDSKSAKQQTPGSAGKKDKFLVPATKQYDLSRVGVKVMARWIDKLYYAGKVTDWRPDNKYVVIFEDGANRKLPQDQIIFGDEDVLPLIDQSVHAMVTDEEYEPGLVTTLEIEDGTAWYTVICESKTVRVKSSEIYLTDDQAKAIQSIYNNEPTPSTPSDETKRPHRSIGNGRRDKGDPETPEPGYSGGVPKRGRRGRQPKRGSVKSESSDVSDIMDSDLAPNSPDSVLEAIDGVQPELQKTPKESQINSSS